MAVWTVGFSTKAAKQYEKLPAGIKSRLILLLQEIECAGPVRGNWKNYSKLSKTEHHCHLKRGRPTYVACWKVVDNKVQIVEVYYVGTHEKAPY